MKNNFKEWLKCALIRALKTVAQSALGVLSGCVLFSEVNWAVVASTALLSGIYSILTSIAGLPEVEEKSDKKATKKRQKVAKKNKGGDNMRCRVLDCEDYRITQYYSYKHKGIDMVKAPSNTCPIIAHSDGYVTFCQTGQKNNPGSTGNASYGNCVKIKHSNGYSTLYAHMSDVYVKKGQYVYQGQKIGYMGNTGNSYGHHLHFEVREPNENRIDPQPYLHENLPNMKGDYQTYDNRKNKWLPKVDFGSNDYAGNYGNGVSGLRIFDDIEYMVHDIKKGYWLPIVRGASDYAGNLPNDIDGVAIKSDKYKYQVHLLKENRWLPFVDGFDVNDWRNGFAGNLGQVIDAIRIEKK